MYEDYMNIDNMIIDSVWTAHHTVNDRINIDGY